MSDKKKYIETGDSCGKSSGGDRGAFSPGRLQDFFSISKLCADDR